MLAGHGAGAEILMHAVLSGRTRPARLVLMPNRMHAVPARARTRAAWQLTARAAAVPGMDRLLSYAACAAFTPERGLRLSARANPAAADLLRHAFADVPGNSSLARSWAKCARSWPRGAQVDLLEQYPSMDMPVLLLWADRDRLHPLAAAEEALALLPHGQLRVLESTGFLMAYDDPVGLARELAAFCG
jgi:pimeloyl-ACP methyl ester carboxylesterase